MLRAPALLALLALLALAACRSSSADPLVDEYRALAEKFCACTDVGCADTVADDIHAWLYKNAAAVTGAQSSPARSEALDVHDVAMATCAKRLGTAPP